MTTVLDQSLVGYRTPSFAVDIEKGRLRLFATAINETDPVYRDEDAARAAGYPSIPVPPTFFLCLEMERDDAYDWFKDLGIPLAKVLHGEQCFTYHDTVHAGDTVHFNGEIVEIYHKKEGALEFLVHRNFVTRADGQPVAEFDRTLVIRHD